MKAIINLISAILFFTISCEAQVSNCEISWGERLDAKKMLVTDILSTDDENEFYAINQSLRLNGQTFLEKYENLEKTNSTELTNERSRAAFESQDILELNGYLYSLNYVRTNDNISLTVEGLDKDNLTLAGNKETIYSLERVKGRNKSYGEISSTVSNMEQRIAYAVEHPGSADSKSVMTVRVFDDSFEEMWSNDITFPSTKRLTEIYSITVSDDGTVYILTQVFEGKKERVRGERNYEFYLLVVGEEGLESKQQLKLKENYIEDLKLNVAQNGDLMCGGFYSINGYVAVGTFYMTLDAEDYEIKQSSFKEFSMDFLTEGLSDRQTAKANRKKDRGLTLGLNHVTFRDFIAKEDGGAVLIGEYVNIYTTTNTDANGRTTSTTNYRYNDIYVINIDAKGKIQWAKKIPKYQFSSDDGGSFSSFFVVVKNDKLHFIFNDHAANAGVMDGNEIIKYTRNLKTSVVMIASMDGDGNYTREVLIAPVKGERTRLRPKSCEQISENEAILFAISKKYNKFARLTVR